MEASPTHGNRLLSMQPDGLLCALAERGNEDAFGVLHTRYRQQVFAFVYHLLGRPGSVDDAEDLTQEIMQKAYTNLNTRRSGGSFKAWLFRIARNHTFDHIRARKPGSVSLDDVDNGVEPSNVISLHSEVEHRAELSWLVGALGALPERQRQALVMRELGGQSVDEIAETLETSPESAKQLIKRGRASVTGAAEAGGFRTKKLGRDLAAAAPITAIAWLGAGKASAAGATGAVLAGAGAAGGATAGGVAAGASGAGIAVVSGKVAATVLAVAAIGAGGVVVGEQVVARDDQPASERAEAKGAGPAVPAQSLVVGSAAADRAVANKKLANARRERARKRAAEKKRARARAKARAERAVRAKANRGQSTTRGNKGGNSNSTATGDSNGRSSGGGSGNSQSTASPGQGSGGSSNSNSSGGSAGGGSNAGGSGKGRPAE